MTAYITPTVSQNQTTILTPSNQNTTVQIQPSTTQTNPPQVIYGQIILLLIIIQIWHAVMNTGIINETLQYSIAWKFYFLSKLNKVTTVKVAFDIFYIQYIQLLNNF